MTDMQPLDVTGYTTTFPAKNQTYHPLLTAKFSRQLHLIILRQQEKIGRNYWHKDHDLYFAVCSRGPFNFTPLSDETESDYIF